MAGLQNIDARAASPANGESQRRGTALLGAQIGVGLVLIALNLRIGVASVGPVLSSIERGLGISASVASLLTTIPVFAFGAFAFLTPALSRRIGLHRLLGITMAVVAVGIGIRLLPSTAALFGGTVLIGAGIAVGNVCMPAAIKQAFRHRSGVMMGLYSTSLFVGAAVASAFTVPLLVSFGGSWRAALGFWALPAVLAFLVWLPRAVADKRVRGESATLSEVAVERRDEPRLRRLFRDPVAWAVTGSMGTQSLTYYAALTWIPTLLQDGGISAHNAGLLLSYSSVPGIAAALLAPVVARRSSMKWLPAAVSTLLCAAGLTGLLIAPTLDASWVWMTLLGLGQGSAIALSLSYIVLRSPDARHTAHVSTMAQGFGYLFAGLGPLGLGVLHSLTHGWIVPITALLVVLVAQFATGAAANRDRQVLSPRQ